jgi:uncharacterized protein HemY
VVVVVVVVVVMVVVVLVVVKNCADTPAPLNKYSRGYSQSPEVNANIELRFDHERILSNTG